MPSSESLRDLIGRGVRLQPCEAVAIAQQVIASAGVDRRRPPPLVPLPLSSDKIRLDADGSVTCDPGIAPPSPAEVGRLLAEMLPHAGPTRVPGALRFTIARALSEVEAPPFHSVADLSAALARHEQCDRGAVVRDLFARAASKSTTQIGSGVDRRRRVPDATTLRRQLRETDEELFAHLNRTVAAPVAPPTVRFGAAAVDPLILHAESADTATAGGSFNSAGWALGALVALLISFGAGYTVVATLRSTQVESPAAPGPPSTATSTIDASLQPSLDDKTVASGTAPRSGDGPSSSPARRRRSSTKKP